MEWDVDQLDDNYKLSFSFTVAEENKARSFSFTIAEENKARSFRYGTHCPTCIGRTQVDQREKSTTLLYIAVLCTVSSYGLNRVSPNSRIFR